MALDLVEKNASIRGIYILGTGFPVCIIFAEITSVSSKELYKVYGEVCNNLFF